MDNVRITERDRARAKKCVECPVCRNAREKQKGLAFWFVKAIEGNICPYCKAYEKVYRKKAHQPTVKPAKGGKNQRRV